MLILNSSEKHFVIFYLKLCVSVLLALVLLYLSLQNSKFYNFSLSNVTKTWSIENEEIKLVSKPYDKISNSNYIRWDATFYYSIMKHGYLPDGEHGEYIYAFFPLFPLLWRISQLPPVGILFLNYLLFSIGLFILLRIFSNFEKELVLSIFSFPTIIIFFLPYTEALFFVLISLGIYSLLRNKYWIYFAAYALAAMTRPAAILLIGTILTVEIILLIRRNKELLHILKSLIYKILPIIIGTFVAAYYQVYNSDLPLLKFVNAQTLWDKSFEIPTKIYDWSLEGFSINLTFLIVLFIPFVGYLIFLLRNYLIHKKQISINEYIILYSLIYIIIATFTTIFFQKGSLNGLFRYTTCTPFFFILIISFYNKFKMINKKFIIISFLFLFITAYALLSLIPYSSDWSFSDLGFFIICSITSLILFNEYKNKKLYKWLLFFIILINLIWTTYLFDMYISNAWIFT